MHFARSASPWRTIPRKWTSLPAAPVHTPKRHSATLDRGIPLVLPRPPELISSNDARQHLRGAVGPANLPWKNRSRVEGVQDSAGSVPRTGRFPADGTQFSGVSWKGLSMTTADNWKLALNVVANLLVPFVALYAAAWLASRDSDRREKRELFRQISLHIQNSMTRSCFCVGQMRCGTKLRFERTSQS